MPTALLLALLRAAVRRPARVIAVHALLLIAAVTAVGARLYADAAADGRPEWSDVSRSVYDNSLRGVWGYDHPDVVAYEDFQARYGSDELVVWAVSAPGALTGEDLLRVGRFAEALEADGFTARWIGDLPYAPESLVFGEAPTAEEMTDLAQRLGHDPSAARLVHQGAEGWDLALMVGFPLLGADDAARGARMDAVRTLWADQEVPARWIADGVGTPVFLAGVRDSIFETLQETFPLVNLLVVGLCWVVFRRWRRVVLVLAALLQGEVLSMSAFVLSGRGFDYISAFLATCVVVVGFAANIHLFTRYAVERRRLGPAEALEAAANTVARPCAVSVTTTAAALLTLGLAPMGAIADFGLFSALGMVLVLLSAFSLAPALIVRFDRVDADTPEPRIPDPTPIARAAYARPWTALGATALVTAAAALAMLRLDIGSNFVESFNADHPVTAATRHVSARFPDFVPTELDLRWEVPPTSGADLLARVSATEAALAAVPVDGAPLGDAVIVSMADVARAWCLAPGRAERCVDGLPLPAAADALVADGTQPAGLVTWAPDGEGYRARLTVLTPSLDADVAVALADRLEAAAATATEGSRPAITGLAPLWNRLEVGVVDTLLRSFLGGAALALGLVALALKDLRASLVAVLPNLLPLFVVTGFAGAACEAIGIQFNSSAMVYLTVAIGIVVDDTLFFLLGWLQGRREGRVGVAVLDHVMGEAGPGILLTSVCLSVGFATLSLAALTNVRMMGLLCAAAIVVALLGDLVVLPALVRLSGMGGETVPVAPARMPVRRGLSGVVLIACLGIAAASAWGWSTGRIGTAAHLAESIFAFFLIIVVAHDAVHGAVHGNRRLNSLAGWASCAVLGVPFPVFKRSHMLHHAKTMQESDPDVWCHGPFWQAPPLPVRWFFGNLPYYKVLPQLDRTAWIAAGLHIAAIVLALVLAPSTALVGWLLPMQCAIFCFAVFTAWLPHGVFLIGVADHADHGPGRETWALQWLTLFHEDHHRRPAYPFYQYPELFMARVAHRPWL